MERLTELRQQITSGGLSPEEAREELKTLTLELVLKELEDQNPNSNIDFGYHIQKIDIDIDCSCSETEGEIYNQLDENQAFNVEIIYFSSAIKYLAEKDPSLRESIEIAINYCCDLEALNSCTLASLHMSQRERENYTLDLSELWEQVEEIRELIEEIEEQSNNFRR